MVDATDGASKGDDRPVNVLCQTCLRRTKHEILREFRKAEHDEVWGVGFYDFFQIVRCRGCETVSFRTAHTSDIDEDPETGEPIVTEHVYPYRLAGRNKMDGSERLPLKVRKIYEETHTALAANASILGTIGIRSVVEAVCKDKNAVGSTLKERIDDLAAKGLLASTQAQFLHQNRLVGNVAVHEIEPANDATLKMALDIIENLLQTVYLLPAAVAEGKP